MSSRFTWFVTLSLLLASSYPAFARKWTDTTGKFSVEADLVQVKEGKAILKKKGGKLITVPLARLSVADRRYLQSLSQPGSKPSVADGTRKFPSFPDAVTEPPSWIGPDPPFDVARFFAAPPPDQNAAPLYLDALFEFNETLAYCYADRGAQYSEKVKQRALAARKREKQLFQFDEARRQDARSIDNAAVDQWLAEYETGFQKLAQAQQCPQCVFETGLSIDSLSVNANAARDVARVVGWRTRRDLEQGDLERPVQGVEMLLRLSRDVRPRAELGTQLVVASLERTCCVETASGLRGIVPGEGLIPSILSSPDIKPEHCDRLLAALLQHEAEAIDPFLEGCRAEYLIARKALHDLQHRTGTFELRYMQDVLGVKGSVDAPFACIKTLFQFHDYSNRMARERFNTQAPPPPAMLGWNAGGKIFPDNEYAKEVTALNLAYARVLALTEQTSLQRFKTPAQTHYEPLRETTLAIFLDSARGVDLFAKVALDTETLLQGTKCLVALRRWQLDSDAPPPDLATLVKAAGIQEIPTDPYADQPLKMATLHDQPIIYSVGVDGKDDQGRKEWNFNPKEPQGDLVFQLATGEAATKKTTLDGRPDLQVTRVFLNEAGYLRARIRNSGNAPAMGVRVRFFVGDQLIGTSRPLALQPGIEQQASSVKLQEGSHAVKVVVDPDNRVDESDESNNATEITLSRPH